MKTKLIHLDLLGRVLLEPISKLSSIILLVTLPISLGFSQEAPHFLQLAQTFPFPNQDQSRSIILSPKGTVIRMNFFEGSPPGSDFSTLLPAGVYVDHYSLFGGLGDQEIIQFFPDLESNLEGPYFGPFFQQLYPVRVTADSRPNFASTITTDLKQFVGGWKSETMNSVKGTKVADTGCVLTTLSMATGLIDQLRTPENFAILKGGGFINNDGDVIDWIGTFNRIKDFSGNTSSQIIDAHQLIQGGGSLTTSGSYASEASNRVFESLEHILKSRNAAAIIQVPSLGSPNDPARKHFVLCVGVESDTVDGLPLKRLRINDPGRNFFSRKSGTAVRYLDQHSDSLLRPTDYFIDNPSFTVRYFIIPTGTPSNRRQTRNNSYTGDFVSMSAGDGITLFPSINGQFFDFVQAAIDDKVAVHSNASENLNDPTEDTGAASTTSLLNPPTGAFTVYAFGAAGGPDQKFVVAIGRRGIAAATPQLIEGTIAGATGLGSVSFTLIDPPAVESFTSWIESFPTIPAALRGANDDADRDGVVNLIEFYYGTLPNSSVSVGGFLSARKVSNTKFQILYRRAQDRMSLESAYLWSNNLTNWREASELANGIQLVISDRIVESSGDGNELVEMTATVTSGVPNKLFFKLRVTESAN